MTVYSLNGDFTAHLTELFETLESGVARGGGTGLSISGGFPYGVTLEGSGLFFQSSGPYFLTGTVTSVDVTQITLGTNGSGNTFTDLLQIDGLSIDASRLYSLVERTDTSSLGRFESNVFLSALREDSIVITGSDNADTIRPNAFLGLGGQDSLYGFDGNDTLFGGASGDVLSGGDGDDWLVTGGGRNLAQGGSGNDRIEGGGGSDTIFGGSGNDQISGGSGANVLGAGAGADHVTGGVDADTVYGGAGRDTVFGYGGNDVLGGGQGRDTVNAGAGADTVFAGTEADLINGQGGSDLLWAGGGNDTVVAGAGQDDLRAGAGDDRLFGGAGQDTLNGGAGNDTMTGGADADVFVLSAGSDVIRDFRAGDRIDMSGLNNVSGFGDLDALLSQLGSSVTLEIGNGQNLTIENVDLADLGASDFIF